MQYKSETSTLDKIVYNNLEKRGITKEQFAKIGLGKLQKHLLKHIP